MRGHWTPGVHAIHYSSSPKQGKRNLFTSRFTSLIFDTQAWFKRRMDVSARQKRKLIIHIVNIASGDRRRAERTCNSIPACHGASVLPGELRGQHGRNCYPESYKRRCSFRTRTPASARHIHRFGARKLGEKVL
ncbi:hypothetical protein ABVT39_018779 [Epinephelus coioides]